MVDVDVVVVVVVAAIVVVVVVVGVVVVAEPKWLFVDAKDPLVGSNLDFLGCSDLW